MHGGGASPSACFRKWRAKQAVTVTVTPPDTCAVCRWPVLVQSPKVDTPPLNHIGLWIDDLEAAVKHLTAAGVRFTPGGIRKGAAGHNVIFIHPKVRARVGIEAGECDGDRMPLAASSVCCGYSRPHGMGGSSLALAAGRLCRLQSRTLLRTRMCGTTRGAN